MTETGGDETPRGLRPRTPSRDGSLAVARPAGAFGAVLMDGGCLLAETVADLRVAIAAAGGPRPCLATVFVGDDRAGLANLEAKHRAAAAAGMASARAELPPTATQVEVEAAVARFAADPDVHGVFVQLPLPDHVDAGPVLARLPPDKDVDGLTERNTARLLSGRPGHVPGTPFGILRLLARYGVPIAGAHAVVVGRSPLVGLPVALLLAHADATVTIAERHTPALAVLCRDADIVVSAADVVGLITADHVRPGAAVVDVGVTRTPDGIVGDVDVTAVCAVAGALAPMPGGTGPATIACLLENTVAAARTLGAFPSIG